MDYVIIVIIATLITGFLSGFVLGKLLGMELKEQLVLGTLILFLAFSILDAILAYNHYQF